MSTQAIDNANLKNYRKSSDLVGFAPIVSYAVSGSNVTVTDASTVPAGDTFSKTHVRLLDDFGGEVKGTITIDVGGTGYTSAPAVVFSGGAGTGAAGTAVISGGKVVSVTITSPGTGYTSDPAIAFTGGGGFGAAGTVVRSTTTVASVTMVAAARNVVLSSSALDLSRGLKLMATVLTDNQIAADGRAINLGAAGNLGSWDSQKNA